MTEQSDLPFLASEQTIDPSLLTLLDPLDAEWNLDSAQNSGFSVPDLPAFDPTPQSFGNGSGQGLRGDLTIIGLGKSTFENGVEQPLAPCSHCRRQRLKCYVLQTTSHNPNPVKSCSSCVALFQDCSLAEQGKRPACDFETPQPVIGRLHGIPDVDVDLPLHDPLRDPEALWTAPNPAPTKRSHSRSIHKTQPLRNWFSAHLDHPYPSDEEKTYLIEQSGLTRTQVIDWFTNARRRNRLSSSRAMSRKVFRQGSPMPTPLLLNMSPLERWRHSPPEDEPASAAAIKGALSQDLGINHDLNLTHATELQSYHYSTHTTQLTADLSSSAQTSDSAASFYSFSSSNTPSICSARSAESHSDAGTRRPGAGAFSCSVCMRRFRKNSDLRRHVASIHRIGTTRWVCANPLIAEQSNCVWRVGQTQPECTFCGQPSPAEDHFKSHEFESCGKRSVEDRTFFRKDHLWQHLHKFHGCRKWEGWSIQLELLQQPLGKKEDNVKVIEPNSHRRDESTREKGDGDVTDSFTRSQI
ncbi:putative homeobox and C2H2 transcription factor [Xylaria flabelliformis]|nr:putative homeobox and C2H2 transcription factor [Xylaria flabelliformis]